ncbi:MAG TPA: helix-turn-helix transcriptional regulator [Blastocatellia bacterium]|nr:helix-turn-helix transcriptional regulator [Blastocatellia bacterium]
MLKNFGQLLSQKRKEADLSIQELAKLSGLPEDRLEAFEQGYGDHPTFDTCYRLGQAISARSGKLFVLQDLWQALKTDKLEVESSPKICLE